jgi:LuxR family maltose regulon positive regulatory protein
MFSERGYPWTRMTTISGYSLLIWFPRSNIISPDVCTETRSILKVDPLPPVAIIIRSLINELDRIENPIILALDDYHLIRDRRIHELIAGLLHHPSPSMHLVLIARRDPPLQLTALRASGQMVEIRTGDLRFTLEETQDLLQQMTGAHRWTAPSPPFWRKKPRDG